MQRGMQHDEIGASGVSVANQCRIFLFSGQEQNPPAGGPSTRTRCGVWMNENKENRGGIDKTLKEELFSARACLFLTPRGQESRPGSERGLLPSVQ